MDEVARRCGLVTPIGWSQTLAPVHDSFADYFSGLALSRQIVALPDRLYSGDEQRLLFAVEMSGAPEVS